MAFDLDHALRYLIAAEGSDLHLKVPSYPLIRLHGHLEPIPGTERLYPEDTEQALQRDAARRGQARGVPRRERGRLLLLGRGPRPLPRQRVPPARLDLGRHARHPGHDQVRRRARAARRRRPSWPSEERGIILLTGTTGSGKSTTLAAMIDHMNRTMHKHIVTIEDPIEFLHRDRNSIINQREVGAGHGVLQARAAPRAAPGPGRDPGRRDARRGDGAHRAVRGRDRPPRALHAAHGRRAGDRQPHHRLLPAPSAAAGARDDRRHAEGHRLPAPRRARPTARAASRAARSWS